MNFKAKQIGPRLRNLEPLSTDLFCLKNPYAEQERTLTVTIKVYRINFSTKLIVTIT